MTKQRLALALTTLLGCLLLWTLRPLRSKEWTIEFDPEMQHGKDDFLSKLSTGSYPSNRPNVVLILADDLGLTDISLYGSSFLETPAIDSIGLDGMTFTQGYASSPICSPSRAGLLTGRYQNRYGFDSQPMTRYARTNLEDWVVNHFINTYPMHPIKNASIPWPSQIEKQGMPPTEILLSEALSAVGYRCDIIGKWHLGYGDLQNPNNRGFDSFYGFLEAFSYYIDPNRPNVESWKFEEFSEKYIWHQKRKGYSAIQKDNVTIEVEGHLTDVFAAEAVKRIEAASQSHQPFFLYLPFSAPHTPFQALNKYTEGFSHVDDPRKRIYYAMIAQLDDAVGQVLEALDTAGIADETLVIFSSDNGGATYTGATGNDPLRGGKMSHFEGGLAVPLMMRWPGKISPGTQSEVPVIQLDLFSTVMAAAEVPIPEDRIIDGVDLLDPSNKVIMEERPLFWRNDYNHVVQIDGWKLMMNNKDGNVWLFNLKTDREEEHNLAEEKPDIVQKLQKIFQQWNMDMADPAWPRVMDYYFDEDGEGYWFAI